MSTRVGPAFLAPRMTAAWVAVELLKAMRQRILPFAEQQIDDAIKKHGPLRDKSYAYWMSVLRDGLESNSRCEPLCCESSAVVFILPSPFFDRVAVALFNVQDYRSLKNPFLEFRDAGWKEYGWSNAVDTGSYADGTSTGRREWKRRERFWTEVLEPHGWRPSVSGLSYDLFSRVDAERWISHRHWDATR